MYILYRTGILRMARKIKKPRGFAAISKKRQREIARKGGKTAHKLGKAHTFTSVEARKAGQKGGKIAHARGTAHEFTSAEAAKAGRKGGKS